MEQLKPYEIKRIGRLSLVYKTIIGRKPTKKDIEISFWNKTFDTRWTIITFDYDKNEDIYDLKSVGSRIAADEIDYNDLKELIKYAYDWLNDITDDLDDAINLIEEYIERSSNYRDGGYVQNRFINVLGILKGKLEKGE